MFKKKIFSEASWLDYIFSTDDYNGLWNLLIVQSCMGPKSETLFLLTSSVPGWFRFNVEEPNFAILWTSLVLDS